MDRFSGSRISSCALFLLTLSINVREFASHGYVVKNPIRFPYGGPFIGLFLAIAVPIDLPEYNVFVSYNLEANYNLPQNETEFVYPPIITKRSIEREVVYRLLENKLTTHGFSRQCLLRMICEAANYALKHSGVLGDIFHVALSPSASVDEKIDRKYAAAEDYGKYKRHCRKYEKMCSVSVLDAISLVY